MKAKTKYRYRLTFGKGEAVKYVAHLDTVLAWTRAFRRSDIPLAYSQGFNPQARIQVAASLPLGYLGLAELMDIYLTAPVPPADIQQRVATTLPQGFSLHHVEAVDAALPGLQGLVRRGLYHVILETSLSEADLKNRVAALLAAETVTQTRVRRKKMETFNLRPWVHALSFVERDATDAHFQMELSAGQQGNLRPTAVLQAMALHTPDADDWYQITRTGLIFAPEN